jgi:hypothetical protein
MKLWVSLNGDGGNMIDVEEKKTTKKPRRHILSTEFVFLHWHANSGKGKGIIGYVEREERPHD